MPYSYAFYKGDSQEKTFAATGESEIIRWAIQPISCCEALGFSLSQMHVAVVTTPWPSDENEQGGCKMPTMVYLRLEAYSFSGCPRGLPSLLWLNASGSSLPAGTTALVRQRVR
jgi:hypothetical protein